MDMKRHMVICFFISMSLDRKKEWDSNKMEIIIKKVNKNKLLKKKWSS